MKIIIFITICLVFISCTRQVCPGTINVNRNMFKRYLIILNQSKHPRKLVFPKEVDEAIGFLEIVSGINSKAELDNIRVYKNKNDFRNDIKQWEEWYKENKCKLTIQYVDSAFKSVGLKY
ncbi:MAG TPA: hypothetical protein VJU78_14235 [Chitinophagaceae bacterium]|nr:hypothetical protein [Chitinophagaceae bacterium]